MLLLLVLPPASVRAASRSVDLLSWSPGKARTEIEAELQESRLRPIRRGAHALILEAPILDELFARQRALLEFDSEEKLSGVTVHLLPEQEGAGEELLALYEESRDLLLKRLGSPSVSRESGRVAPGQMLRALAEGSLMRCLQWEGERTVRLGIPTSAGSEPRVEVRIVAGSLPSLDGFWGKDF